MPPYQVHSLYRNSNVTLDYMTSPFNLLGIFLIATNPSTYLRAFLHDRILTRSSIFHACTRTCTHTDTRLPFIAYNLCVFSMSVHLKHPYHTPTLLVIR